MQRSFFNHSAFCVVDCVLYDEGFRVNFFDFGDEFLDFEARYDRENYLSFRLNHAAFTVAAFTFVNRHGSA